MIARMIIVMQHLEALESSVIEVLRKSQISLRCLIQEQQVIVLYIGKIDSLVHIVEILEIHYDPVSTCICLSYILCKPSLLQDMQIVLRLVPVL